MRPSKKSAVALATSFAFAAPFAAPAAAQQQQTAQGGLIAALNNVNVEIERFSALNDLTITVVNVEDVLNNNNVLNNARFLNNNEILTDFLNDSVNNNNVEVLKNFLNNNDIAISDVVAIDVLSGGDVVVFAQ